MVQKLKYFCPCINYLFFLILAIFKTTHSFITSNAHNHGVIKLENGNFLVLTCNGKYILDPTFNNSYNYTLDVAGSAPFYDNLGIFSKEDGGYIIYIQNSLHYFLSPNGIYINSFSRNKPNSNNYCFYTIAPYNHLKEEYYYYFIYFYSNNKIIFQKYIYNLSSKNYINSNNYTKYPIVNNSHSYITCQVMNYSNNRVISCFYISSSNNEYYLNCTVFNSQNLAVIQSNKTRTKGIKSVYHIKSEIMSLEGKQKVLVCLLVSFNNTNIKYLFYAGYNINTNSFKEGYIENKNDCIINTNYFSISYFRETEEFIVCTFNECSSNSYYIYLIYSFDSNFNYSYFGALRDFIVDDSCCSCQSFKFISLSTQFSIIFSSIAQKYGLVTSIGDYNTVSLFIINKDINIINPIELTPKYPLENYVCENYSNFKNQNSACLENSNMQYLSDSSMNYLEKCSNEIKHIKSTCSCNNYKIKTFNFSYSCSEKFPYEIIKTHICVEKCDNNSLLNGTCRLNYHKEEITEKITEIITEEITEIITEEKKEEPISEIMNNILNENSEDSIEKIRNLFSSGDVDNQLDNIINGGTDITISNKKTLYQITSSGNQNNPKNHNISTIILGECETLLKQKNDIDLNTSLLILKLDTFIDNSNIPIIQYEVYNPITKEKLDISDCDESKIEINIPVDIDENNLDKYNQESDYYNDRCYVSKSNSGTDMPMKYRREEFINNNLTLCESECEYLGYNNETKNSKCKCDVKNEISLFNIKIDTQLLYDKFVSLKSSNIDIIKCYYLLFKKEYLEYNIGSFVILFIILIFIIFMFIFIFKGYQLLNNKIDFVVLITKGNPNKNLKNNNLPTISIIRKKRKRKRKRKNKADNNKNKKGKNDKEDNNNKKNKKNKNHPPFKKVTLMRSINKNKNIKNEDISTSSQKIKIKNSNDNELIPKDIDKKEKPNKKKKKLKSKLIKKISKTKNNQIYKNKSNNIKYNLNDYELNTIIYTKAIIIDKRKYFEYYLSLLKKGDIFLFSFVPNNDYNSMVLKICLFFFSFGAYYTVNALFFTDSTMDKIYEDEGEYDFIYQIPKLIYSNLICTVINLIVKTLSLSERDILKIKIRRIGEKFDQKVKNIKRCLLIKFILYYLISFLFLFIFWFYVSTFCAVYQNTQLYLIKDTSISFSLSLIYPIIYYLIPGIFRIPSLRSKQKNKECFYKISLLLQAL